MMLTKMPQLNLSRKQHHVQSAAQTSRSRLSRKETIQSEIQLLGDDSKLVPFEYFKGKEMFCTISRQNDKVIFYTEKNSVLLGIWINLLRRICKSGDVNMRQQIQSQQLQLQMLHGVPPQFMSFNNKTTISAFLSRAIKQLTTQNKLSKICYQKTLFRMLIDYPYFVYCGVSYIRAKALSYYKKNMQKYQLQAIGNESDILRDYSKELRNLPLLLIADSLSISMTIINDFEEIVGCGQFHLSLRKCGSSYCYWDSQQIQKKICKQGSETFESTVASSSHQLDVVGVNKMCTRCLSLKRGKFCQCRKQKSVIEVSKKYCCKCDSRYIFVCKCYLDQ